MPSNPNNRPEGLKAMLAQAKATLFPAPLPEQRVRLEEARDRSTGFLNDLDTVLARSQAALKKKDIRL